MSRVFLHTVAHVWCEEGIPKTTDVYVSNGHHTCAVVCRKLYFNRHGVTSFKAAAAQCVIVTLLSPPVSVSIVCRVYWLLVVPSLFWSEDPSQADSNTNSGTYPNYIYITYN